MTTPAAHRYAEFVVARSHVKPGTAWPCWFNRDEIRRLMACKYHPALDAYWQRWDARLAAETARVTGEEE
jgi:hypothetical protein